MPMSADDKKEIMQYEEEQKREWNKLILNHIAKLREIRKPSVQFPNTIEKACGEYFELCADDGIKPTIAGLSLALGTNRETLLSWVRGEVSVESADIIRHYFNLMEIFDETALKDNRINGLVGIFNMKNNYNYKDEAVVKHIEEDKVSDEEIARRYLQQHNILKETPKVIEIKPAEVKEKKEESTESDDIPF